MGLFSIFYKITCNRKQRDQDICQSYVQEHCSTPPFTKTIPEIINPFLYKKATNCFINTILQITCGGHTTTFNI